MRRFAGMVLGGLLMAASPAAAESWRMTGWGGEKPQRSVYLVDTDSISRIGDTVRFRTSTIWESFNEDRDFNKSITTREGNCATMSSVIVANSYYADGALQSSDESRGNVTVHGPQTLMRGVLEAVCTGAGYESERLDSAEATVRAWLGSS